jgi:hypothetical protein
MSTPSIYLSSQYAAIGADRDLRRRCDRGELVRVAPGAYVEAEQWAQLGQDARYRLTVAAAARRAGPEVQFSHDSAAALWRLPSFGPWPAVIHTLHERSTGGRSHHGIRTHCLGLDPNPHTIDGATVTSLARTLVDMAGQRHFTRAVAMVDDGLRTLDEQHPRFAIAQGTTLNTPDLALSPTKLELHSLIDALDPFPGVARARRTVDFADGLSGSVGESLSRVQFLALGYPMPELQVPFYDEQGYIGTVDFYWPQLDLIGEFDGKSKYGDERLYQRGLTAQQIVLIEKSREDRLRRRVRDLARWDWAIAYDRFRLDARLRPHGLVATRR